MNRYNLLIKKYNKRRLVALKRVAGQRGGGESSASGARQSEVEEDDNQGLVVDEGGAKQLPEDQRLNTACEASAVQIDGLNQSEANISEISGNEGEANEIRNSQSKDIKAIELRGNRNVVSISQVPEATVDSKLAGTHSSTSPVGSECKTVELAENKMAETDPIVPETRSDVKNSEDITSKTSKQSECNTVELAENKTKTIPKVPETRSDGKSSKSTTSETSIQSERNTVELAQNKTKTVLKVPETRSDGKNTKDTTSETSKQSECNTVELAAPETSTVDAETKPLSKSARKKLKKKRRAIERKKLEADMNAFFKENPITGEISTSKDITAKPTGEISRPKDITAVPTGEISRPKDIAAAPTGDITKYSASAAELGIDTQGLTQTQIKNRIKRARRKRLKAFQQANSIKAHLKKAEKAEKEGNIPQKLKFEKYAKELVRRKEQSNESIPKKPEVENIQKRLTDLASQTISKKLEVQTMARESRFDKSSQIIPKKFQQEQIKSYPERAGKIVKHSTVDIKNKMAHKRSEATRYQENKTYPGKFEAEKEAHKLTKTQRDNLRKKLKKQLRMMGAGTSPRVEQEVKRSLAILAESAEPFTKKQKTHHDYPPQAFMKLESGIKMAIVKNGFPHIKLTLTELGTIQKEIFTAIDKLPRDAPQPFISFSELQEGAFILQCDDYFTVDWLISNFHMNNKVIGGSLLKVVKATNVLKPVKVAFKYEDVHEKDGKVLLEKLKWFNPKFQTDKWNILGKIENDFFIKWIFEVDLESLEAIKEANFIGWIQSSRGSFTILAGLRKSDRDIINEENRRTAFTNEIASRSTFGASATDYASKPADRSSLGSTSASDCYESSIPTCGFIPAALTDYSETADRHSATASTYSSLPSITSQRATSTSVTNYYSKSGIERSSAATTDYNYQLPSSRKAGATSTEGVGSYGLPRTSTFSAPSAAITNYYKLPGSSNSRATSAASTATDYCNLPGSSNSRATSVASTDSRESSKTSTFGDTLAALTDYYAKLTETSIGKSSSATDSFELLKASAFGASLAALTHYYAKLSDTSMGEAAAETDSSESSRASAFRSSAAAIGYYSELPSTSYNQNSAAAIDYSKLPSTSNTGAYSTASDYYSQFSNTSMMEDSSVMVSDSDSNSASVIGASFNVASTYNPSAASIATTNYSKFVNMPSATRATPSSTAGYCSRSSGSLVSYPHTTTRATNKINFKISYPSVREPSSSPASTFLTNRKKSATFGSKKTNRPVPATFGSKKSNKPVSATLGSKKTNKPVPATLGNKKPKVPAWKTLGSRKSASATVSGYYHGSVSVETDSPGLITDKIPAISKAIIAAVTGKAPDIAKAEADVAAKAIFAATTAYFYNAEEAPVPGTALLSNATAKAVAATQPVPRRRKNRSTLKRSDPNEGPQPGGPALLENPDFPGPAPGNFRGGPGDFPPGPDFPGGQGEFQDGGNEFPDKPGNFRGGPGNFHDGADFSEDFPPEDMPFPNEPGRQRNFGGDGKQPLLSDRPPGPHGFPPNDMEGPPRPFDDRFPPDGEGFPPRNKNGRFMDRDFEGYPPDDFGPPPFRDDFPPFNDGFPPGRGGRFGRGGRGGRGRFNQGPDFDRFAPPPDFQNDGPFGPDDRFPFPGDRMGPGRGGMGPGRGGPGRGGPGRGGDRMGPGRGPRNFDPGFGPGGFPDDPFFREGRPPRRTIDYTHQSSEDFNPHYDYESEFQDDVTRFRDDFKTGVSMVPRDPIIFSQVGIESIDYGHGLTDVITTFVPPKKLEIKPPVKVFDYSHQRDMSPHRERDMPPHRERDMLMGKRDFLRPYAFPPRERDMFMRDRYLEEDDDEAEEDRNFDRVLDRDGNYMDEEDDNDYRDVDRDYRGDDREKDYDRDDREKDRDYDRDGNRDKYRKETRDYDRDKGRDSKRDWDKDKVREDGDRGRDRSREDDRSREGPDKRYKWVRPEKDNKKSDSGSKKESNDMKSSDSKPQVPSYKSENKSESMLIEDILYLPKRLSRPKQLVIILRGLPGSGKTYFAKLIKDKEIENGGSAPRILSLDDYFMAEVEVTDTDPDTGKKIIRKEFKFEYEIGMEESYRQSLFKSFKKTIDDRFFPFIIVDAIHDKTRHYEQYWSYAKQRGFQVYIAEMDCNDPATCHKRNTHNRTLEEITKILKAWEKKPHHFMSIDVRSLLQEAAITEVEMEDDSNTKTEEDNTDDKEEDSSNNAEDMPFHVPSRWEKMETTEEKLYQLDGLRAGTKKHSSMEDYLQLPDDYEERKCQPGKKRVRWADLEERKEQDRIRAIGFVVGQTDWNKMTDPSHADRALTRTKYF